MIRQVRIVRFQHLRQNTNRLTVHFFLATLVLDIFGDIAAHRHDAEKSAFFIEKTGFGDPQCPHAISRFNLDEGIDSLFRRNRLAIIFREFTGCLVAKKYPGPFCRVWSEAENPQAGRGRGWRIYNDLPDLSG